MTQPAGKSNTVKLTTDQIAGATSDMMANMSLPQLSTALKTAVLLRQNTLISDILSHPNASQVVVKCLTDAINEAQAMQ